METGGEKIRNFSICPSCNTHTPHTTTSHTHIPEGGIDISVKTVKKMLVLRPVLKEKEESEQQSVRGKQIKHLKNNNMDHAIVYHTDNVSKQMQSLKHQHIHTDAC